MPYALSRTDDAGVITFISRFSNKRTLKWTTNPSEVLTFPTIGDAEASWMCSPVWGAKPMEFAALKPANPFASFINHQ